MNYATKSTDELKQIEQSAREAIAGGEARGLREKHPLMRAAYGVLGAVSGELANRKQ